jgi:hypothetical protein
MTGITDIFGKRSDGATTQTKAGFKASGLDASGGYNEPPKVPPPPPPQTTNKPQTGDIERRNADKLEKMLMERGMSKEEARAKMQKNEQSTGLRYK